MGPWLRVLALFGAVALGALVLKRLPSVLVFVLVVGGVAYAHHVLITRPKRERARTAAEALGLRRVTETEAGLRGLPFSLLERPGAAVSEVMAGSWGGTAVRVFDLEVPRPEAPVGVGRFTCVLASVPLRAPHLVVEPLAFLTPEPERPNLPACPILEGFDVRCEEPAFAAAFLEGAVGAWLVGERERFGLELRGSGALLYQPWVPPSERDALLGALSGFLAAAPASEGRR